MFTLCSGGLSALQMAFSLVVSKYCKMGDLSYFQTRQILGACLAEASITKTVTFLGVSRAAVSEAMTAYTNHGQDIISYEE